MNSAQSRADTALQGEELIWSTSDAALRIAVMETISLCCAPLAAAASAPSGLKQSKDEDQRRRLLLGKSGVAPAAEGEGDDFSYRPRLCTHTLFVDAANGRLDSRGMLQ
jgi:hypothetical protein